MHGTSGACLAECFPSLSFTEKLKAKLYLFQKSESRMK